jgi:periplasmic protein TonB
MSTTTLNLPPSKTSVKRIPMPAGAPKPLREPLADSAPPRPVFAASLLEMNHMGRPRRTADYVFSLSMHLAVLALLLLLPLVFTQGLDVGRFMTTFVVAPPPPPPPPPPAAAVQVQPRPAIVTKGAIVSPTVIPKKILMIKEAPPPTDASVGVIGGVPGGVPGGQMGGVLGGILGGIPSAVRPPAQPMRTVRVGGDVKPPRLIYRIDPDYPVIAKISRIQGDVVIDAVIDAKGNVVQMRLVSGPPLLTKQAMDALSHWRYQPTLLNGEPVAVEFRVVVAFTLAQ